MMCGWYWKWALMSHEGLLGGCCADKDAAGESGFSLNVDGLHP